MFSDKPEEDEGQDESLKLVLAELKRNPQLELMDLFEKTNP